LSASPSGVADRGRNARAAEHNRAHRRSDRNPADRRDGIEAELVRDDHRLNQQADELIDELRSLNRPRLIVISGPSGVGKDTVIEEMRLLHPEYSFAVTATTRPRRPGEIDGVHYLFMNRQEFEEALENGYFLESAEVYGNLYGVPRKRVEDEIADGRNVVIKVDVQGAATIREIMPDAIFIFLLPPTMGELTSRLRGRKTDNPDALMERASTASWELGRVRDFDYVVFNETDQVQETLRVIDAIIVAEGCRVALRPESGSD
jgi:guanylate kinase